MPKSQDYRDCAVALLTKHGKADVIAPALSGLGLTVVATGDFDTDSLGTFSGEVERTLSPLECARTKAKLACKFTGLPLGLGSEGSFGGGPMPGLLNWDSELLVLHHAAKNFDIVAYAAGPVGLAPFDLLSLQALRDKLRDQDPRQAWIMRSELQVIKGLYGEADIVRNLRMLSLVDDKGRLGRRLRIEPDLRAMHCPQRRKYILQAAQQLADRLQTCCPTCDAPDFWTDEIQPGLPCADCGAPTRLPLALIRHCRVCHHKISEASRELLAEPGKCDLCNP